MRGKVLPMQISWRKTGITPAYAGKSEKKKLDLLKQQGSPPPMRGKEAVQMRLGHKDRITPAYAGKRDRGNEIDNAPWDHPRLCGEKRGLSAHSMTASGSPPPMRGKGGSCLQQGALSRITPAYAGKRIFASSPTKMLEDHPRLCGEK